MCTVACGAALLKTFCPRANGVRHGVAIDTLHVWVLGMFGWGYSHKISGENATSEHVLPDGTFFVALLMQREREPAIATSLASPQAPLTASNSSARALSATRVRDRPQLRLRAEVEHDRQACRA